MFGMEEGYLCTISSKNQVALQPIKELNYSMPKKKIKHSAELTKLLEFLKTKNPTYLQKIKSRELSQEERVIYMDALRKKGMADRKKRFRSFDTGIHKKI